MIGTGTSGANHVLFKDRRDAGVYLIDGLKAYCQKPVCVIGLAKGGIIPAASIAHTLHIPLDILVIKKLFHETNPDFAIGAVAPDMVSVVHWKDAQRAGFDEVSMKHLIIEVSTQVKRDMTVYRRRKKPIDVAEKTIILVDDGAATGASMEVAVLWVRKKHARRIVVALPVAPNDVIARLKPEVDAVITHTPIDRFESVGSYYTSFPQVAESQVVQLLERST